MSVLEDAGRRLAWALLVTVGALYVFSVVWFGTRFLPRRGRRRYPTPAISLEEAMSLMGTGDVLLVRGQGFIPHQSCLTKLPPTKSE